MRVLYTLTIFIGSALLFLIEPAIAKLILPVFGGAPAVWSASLLFFQGALLAGYAYAHGSIRKFGVKKQSFIHIGMMVFAGLFLPFGSSSPAFAWMRGLAERQAGPPALLVIAGLAGLVGLPFFIVSAGSTTLQGWFTATKDPERKNPYFLYSASNLGSMLALLSYPLLIESRLGLIQQGQWWAVGYWGLVAITAVCAFTLPNDTAETASQLTEEAEVVKPTTWDQRRNWVLLAAVPSSLLMGVTTYVSNNVAPIPLLWVVPLALYLLSFILAFARKTLVKAVHLGRILPLIATPLAVVIVLESSTPLVPLAALHLVAFFVAAWMCHARLHEDRPNSAHITEFYLWVAVGGVVGGVFNALVAPLVFSTLAEYPIAIVLALALRPKQYERKAGRADYLVPLGVGMVTLIMVLAVKLGPSILAGHTMPPMEPTPFRTFLVVGIPTILTFFAVDRPVRFAACLGAMFLVSNLSHSSTDGIVATSQRSFFGVHRVILNQRGNMRTLVHGNTTHGIQDWDNPDRPLTYYYSTGPIGQVFTKLKPQLATEHIGLVGLGVGSLAAYGQPGQRMTYFEIDPTVRAVASDPKLFTFLSRTKAKLNIVMGDARLTLNQQPDQEFGLLVLDAFSSDAIPVHLLTKEAVAMYLRKLTPNGLLAFHISNRYLDLEPVLDAIAHELKVIPYIQEDGPGDEEKLQGKTQSRWMLFARRKEDLGALIGRVTYWDVSTPETLPKVWTDDFSNVLGAFKSSDD